MRKTIRFNEKQAAELELLKKRYHIHNDSEAVHLAIQWVVYYYENVTRTFFPPDFEVILQRKRKSYKQERKVY